MSRSRSHKRGRPRKALTMSVEMPAVPPMYIPSGAAGVTPSADLLVIPEALAVKCARWHSEAQMLRVVETVPEVRPVWTPEALPSVKHAQDSVSWSKKCMDVYVTAAEKLRKKTEKEREQHEAERRRATRGALRPRVGATRETA